MTPRARGAAALGVALAVAVACGWRRPAPAVSTVVLVTIDTLRADALSVYGSKTVKTPVADALAAAGTTFLNAAAPMPLTRPSHITMLTSLHPREHGVISNSGRLPDEFTTLGDTFQEAGFRTGGFVGVSLLSRDSGAGRGFERFDVPGRGMHRARHVVPQAVDWLRAIPRSDRVFLWLHLYEPHLPYEPVPAPAVPAGQPEALDWERLEAAAARHGGDVPAATADHARYLYEREVESSLAWTGRVVNALRETGRWDTSAVLLTADHGECFENGVYFDHSDCLYDGAIRVPLILRAPGVAAGATVAEQVDHLAIGPTLLGLAGVKVPSQFRGISLLQAARGDDAALIALPDLSDMHTGRPSPIRSVGGSPVRRAPAGAEVVGIRTPRFKFFDGVWGPELYELAVDPAETRNLAGGPGPEAELRRRVGAWTRALPQRRNTRAKMTPEELEELRALGYVR